jgi:hypothetical protein
MYATGFAESIGSRRPGLGYFGAMITTLESATSQVRREFGGLSAEQLNWTVGEGRWSIAQCLDHLIVINRLYFPMLTALADGAYRPSLWARISPLSGLFGRILVKSLSPDNPTPVKTSTKALPSSSNISADIVARFEAHQSELIRHIRAIPTTVDADRTVVTSPLVSLITYSLSDCLTMLAVHEERHVAQARRVAEAPGFPSR